MAADPSNDPAAASPLNESAASAGPLSHRRRWHAGVVQSMGPPEVIDLVPGYLDPDLLPVDLVRNAYREALAEFGSAALSYGENRGAVEFREAMASLVSPACGPEQVLSTAGTSHALHLIATGLAEPGEVVLVEQTGYDLGRGILADCRLGLREVPTDDDGMEPEALRSSVLEARSGGQRVAFVLVTPTFHNPTGRVMSLGRRRELVAMAHRLGLLLVEDDAYADLDLAESTSRPPTLLEVADFTGVIALRTFSKTLGPGLRLGCLVAEAAMVERLVSHGYFVSGGAPNHTTSLAVTRLIRDGDYHRHLDWLRVQLRTRRDALLGALRAGLGPDPVLRFATPAGGYFLWAWTGAGHREADLLAAATRAGVAIAEGSRFGSTSAPSARLAYSFNSPRLLADAATRLAEALTLERNR